MMEDALSLLHSRHSRKLLIGVGRGYYNSTPCTQRFACVGLISIAVGVVALFVVLCALYCLCCPSYFRDFYRSHTARKSAEQEMTPQQPPPQQQMGPSWATSYPPPTYPPLSSPQQPGSTGWQPQTAWQGSTAGNGQAWPAAYTGGDPYKSGGAASGGATQTGFASPQYGHARADDWYSSPPR